MSGIAGIYNLDGKPADGALLRRMTRVIAHRGPDGEDHWNHGPVAMGHRMLHTTRESLLEQQPLTDESGQLCLGLDGRVDNRTELRQALEAKGLRLRSDTDAELVLRAYECWGEACPEKILGDFALVLWDGRKRQLFCARDIMGLKPLYYWFDGRTVLIASELHQILEDPGVPRNPNEGMIAEYLSPPNINLEETLYEGIYLLPRAHTLVVRPNGMIKRQYWHLGEIEEIRCGSDREYADRFYEVFQEAVRCRLRSCGPVGLELSGGLDSSGIAGMAEKLFRTGGADRNGFEAFSMVFPGEDRDESSYIRSVTEKWNLSFNPISQPGPPAGHYSDQISRSLDFPTFPGHEMFNGVLNELRQRGGRVLLTGDGGDQWLAGGPAHCADLLHGLQFQKLSRQLRWESQILSNGPKRFSPQYVMLRWGVFPLLPGMVQQGIRRLANKPATGVPDWITPRFARQTNLAERPRRPEKFGGPYPTQALRQDFVHGWNFAWYRMEDRYISRFGMEYRHPFLDRRMIEFCLGLPPEQRRRGKETKFILRQALGDLLPEMVRNRLTKAHYGNPAYVKVMRELGGETFFDSLTLASLGWVDAGRVKEMYQHMESNYRRQDPSHVRYLFPLWMICSVELWYRTVFVDSAIHLKANPELFAFAPSRPQPVDKEIQ